MRRGIWIGVALFLALAGKADASSGINFSAWLALEKQNIAESTDEAVLSLPPDQVEVDFLLHQGINLLTSANFEALKRLQLSGIEPIRNKDAAKILRGPPFTPDGCEHVYAAGLWRR